MDYTSENIPGVYIIGQAIRNFTESAPEHIYPENDGPLKVKKGTLVYHQEGDTTYFLGGCYISQEQL